MVRAKSKCGAATQACGRASADRAGGMSSAWSGLLESILYVHSVLYARPAIN